MNTNRERLKLLVNLFDLTVADVAREAKVSRPLVSRYLNGDAQVNPTNLIPKLESALGRIVDRRRKTFFQVTAVPDLVVQDALATVTTLRRDAA